LGWFPNSVGGEQAGIQQTSQHAVYAVATDYAANLSAFSGAAAPLSPPAATTPPPLSNRVYVSFTMTDGDNVQYDQHLMRQRWDDAARGQVPISWSLQPLLLDAAPAVLSYYQRTATAQDDLIAGPSGAGYMFPGSWPHDALSTFTQTSGRYMRAAGLRSLMVYNAPAPGQLPDAAAQAYLQGVNPNGIEGDWS